MMTMIADDGYMDCSTTGDWYVDGDDVDISMDVHQFLGILEEDPLDRDPSLSNHGHFSSVSTEKDGPAVKLENHENSFFQIDASQSSAVVDLNIRDCMASSGNSSEGIEASENPVFRSPFEISSVKVNEPSVSGSSTSFGVHNSSDFVNMVPDIPQWWSDYDVSAQFPDENLLHSTDFNFMLTNEDMMHDMNNFNACLGSNMVSEAQVGGAYSTASDAPFYGLFGSGHELVFDGVYPVENVGTNTYDSIHSTNSYKASAQQFVHTQICKSSDIQAMKMKDEGVDEQLSIKGIRSQSFEVKDEGRCGEFCLGSSAGNSSDSTVTLMPGMKSFRDVKYEKNYQFAAYGEGHCSQPLVSFDKSGRMNGERQETISKPVSVRSDLAKVGLEESGSNSSDCRNDVANDADICIIEDTSPKRGISSAALGKCLATPHRTICTSSFSPVGVGGSRLKATNENQIFRAALKDLSQPKSEATPPDGLLAVPLLKHQRIALSWMVQKETGLRCSGGILADDQGLGKTVSTIALILKERPPSARMSNSRNKCEPETLDLENDDLQVNMLKKDDKHMTNGSSMRSVEGSSSTKGRPAAGTLIVCPTSVLRQWAEELRTKVTSQANLSVLVYHGSNRLKDPYELAKYDVVLTTYSIVSMEVPKQPLVLKDGDEKRKLEAFNDPSLMSSKKRKHQATSEKACVRKGMENVLLESGARPLAKVGWFRVVLDEAQCIKNYRTQVAQACWGLRAKRRWCLSGTPIQNAVDDLYSYFRFLRYDPYAVYKSFCSMVKNPISRNPASGYRKLQAVLKTVMLRRTKGTLLDGQPIITLPPKSVILKKVEFSEKERDFYSQLEADSRAQFQEYAASGTVQQNYVNILLMLLRLRQACDHPLLVKGYDYSSNRNFSINVARNLPREQLISLLNCLEASLAICGICNDPPEDAVVSICGHVFCNQCICEHISGDDSQCPAMNCKVQINVSLVFSRATLRGCLSDQSGHCISLSSLGSDSLEQTEMVESSPDSSLFGSSKITAALEVLRSLANPQEHGLDKARYVVSSQSSSSDTPSRTDSGSCVEKNGLSNSVLAGREKAIVFSQWTGMLDLLEARLKESSIQYRRLDGTMTVCARDKAVKDFNTLPEVSVMIMSLKAASLGLNMVAACHVLLLDLWWNPTTEDQAIDRAHRIGQTRPVTVLRLTVKDTVEDRILALQQKKREMVASAFGEDEKGRRQTRLTVEDLKYLFMCDNGAFST